MSWENADEAAFRLHVDAQPNAMRHADDVCITVWNGVVCIPLCGIVQVGSLSMKKVHLSPH